MCCGGGSQGGLASVKTYPGVEVCNGKHAMPDAEVMARARGLDLCVVAPTGMGGQMITRQDVVRHYHL